MNFGAKQKQQDAKPQRVYPGGMATKSGSRPLTHERLKMIAVALVQINRMAGHDLAEWLDMI